MAAATGTAVQLMKPQVLKNESKGQLGKNWVVEMHEINTLTAGDAGFTKTLTSDIANPQFVSVCQTAGDIALPEFPIFTITPATGSAKATIVVLFKSALTITSINKTLRFKVEGY